MVPVSHLPARRTGMASWDPQSVYEAAGGDEGVLKLAHAWHARVWPTRW